MRLATGVIDFARSRFSREDGVIERLTTREAEVLAFLVDHADEPVARDDLLGAVWGHHALSLSRAVDAAMSRLRKKIEPDVAEPRVLFTVHGHGYRLLVDATAPARLEVDDEPRPRRLLHLGDRRVDLATGYVSGGPERLLLNARERIMLETLIRARGAIVDAHKLARSAGVIGGKSALSNAVARLRAKLEEEPSNPVFLLAVRGEGYRLDAPPPEEPPLYPQDHVVALRSLARHVGLVLGCDDCVIYRRQGDEFEQVAAHGVKCAADGTVRRPMRQRLGEGLVGHAVDDGQPVCVSDVSHDRRYLPDLIPAVSELSVPILYRGEVVGVIDSEAPTASAYDDRLVSAFVMLAAIAAPGFAKVRHP